MSSAIGMRQESSISTTANIVRERAKREQTEEKKSSNGSTRRLSELLGSSASAYLRRTGLLQVILRLASLW